ncbi:hypothetical protein [Caulobacter sp. LjRoot300]|uniref:hypothetical protein n=1 Tax=Caulobacter sp. LjRoot300 TaxID=3342321 RepID=UPI003ECE549C
MAKTPVRRLKVYAAQFGFHDSVVAAPNQAAALAAWGTRQNLFADGRATVTDDPAAIAAAMAHPEIPLRRAVGSTDPFGLEPGLPDVPDPPRRTRPDLKLVHKAKPAKAVPDLELRDLAEPEPEPEPPPPPDRSRLDAAQAHLADIHRKRLAEEADLKARRAALEADELSARRRWSADRKAAEAEIDRARRAYRAEGGAN